MWALDNKTAYAAERNWIRDKEGVHHFVVAVKATFDVSTNGKLTLADEQRPPMLEPEYHGKPGESSLRYDSDLLAVKPCTDVILDAHAHAPKGRKAKSVVTSARVDDMRKALVVHGLRVYRKDPIGGIVMTDPVPFLSLPIRYEGAFGGVDFTDPDPKKHRMDSRNPVGAGFAVNRDHLIDQPAPHIAYQKGDILNKGPAGFGPIDPSWSPRRELAGTYDEKWESNKKPLLPDDYDDLFAASAPADQRSKRHRRGGERVELINLSPEGILAFYLPKIYLTFTTHIGRQRQEHRSRLTSILIESETRQVMLVWQTALAVSPGDIDYLDQTTIREKPYLT